MRILIFLIALNFVLPVSKTDFYPENQIERVAKIALKDKGIAIVREIPVVHKTEKEEPFVFYEFSREEGENFYVAITQAKGRYDYFDYLVAVNQSFEIERIRILKYRSEYGGEIKSKKWLEQFISYSTGELRYKKEISALSGATMSAKSLTADVPRVLKILKDSCE